MDYIALVRFWKAPSTIILIKKIGASTKTSLKTLFFASPTELHWFMKIKIIFGNLIGASTKKSVFPQSKRFAWFFRCGHRAWMCNVLMQLSFPVVQANLSGSQWTREIPLGQTDNSCGVEVHVVLSIQQFVG